MALNKIQVLALINLINQNKIDNPNWRFSQNVFNSILWLYPEVSETIRNNQYDCFYEASVVNKTMGFICHSEGLQTWYER